MHKNTIKKYPTTFKFIPSQKFEPFNNTKRQNTVKNKFKKEFEIKKSKNDKEVLLTSISRKYTALVIINI